MLFARVFLADQRAVAPAETNRGREIPRRLRGAFTPLVPGRSHGFGARCRRTLFGGFRFLCGHIPLKIMEILARNRVASDPTGETDNMPTTQGRLHRLLLPPAVHAV